MLVFCAVVAICFTFSFFNYIWRLQMLMNADLFAFQKINDAVGPLNRIKDILVAGNHPSHGIHGHARAS